MEDAVGVTATSAYKLQSKIILTNKIIVDILGTKCLSGRSLSNVPVRYNYIKQHNLQRKSIKERLHCNRSIPYNKVDP